MRSNDSDRWRSDFTRPAETHKGCSSRILSSFDRHWQKTLPFFFCSSQCVFGGAIQKEIDQPTTTITFNLRSSHLSPTIVFALRFSFVRSFVFLLHVFVLQFCLPARLEAAPPFAQTFFFFLFRFSFLFVWTLFCFDFSWFGALAMMTTSYWLLSIVTIFSVVHNVRLRHNDCFISTGFLQVLYLN